MGLIQKWLKAEWPEDTWFEKVRNTARSSGFTVACQCVPALRIRSVDRGLALVKAATGDVIVVRYADDLVVGFENRTEAERFLEAFRERLAKFGLELHPEKTRLIEFGRFAAPNREKRVTREAGDLHVPGFHALLREAPEQWSVHRLAENGDEAHGGEAARN